MSKHRNRERTNNLILNSIEEFVIHTTIVFPSFMMYLSIYKNFCLIAFTLCNPFWVLNALFD